MKVLFICTHNRCRSILCEAIANQMGSFHSESNIEARSAGSEPAGKIHPGTLAALQRAGYRVTGLSSQSWDAHESFAPDLIITVCDNAASETCPAWFGEGVKVHWGLVDPSAIDGSPPEMEKAFAFTIATVEERVRSLQRVAELGVKGDALKLAMASLGAKV
jgi:arsenate reductase